MKLGRIVGLGVVLAAVAVAGTARAAGPADQAAAVELFQEARKLVEAGDYEHACPKFAEAQRLLPTPGTLLSLGLCYEKAGKLASAYGAYKEAEFYARGAGATDHQAEAQRRAGALALKVAKLAIVVPPATKVQGFELRRDGSVVGEAQWGSPMPADIGWHKIEATAPGKKAWTTTVRIETDGSSASVDVPALEDLPSEAVAYWSGRRTAGVTVGSIGVAGLLVGAITGGVAASKASSAKSHCQPLGDATACDPTGLALRSDVRAFGNAANVSLALGAAATVAGVVLFVTAPGTADKPTTGLRLQVAPAFGMSGATVALQGVW